MPQKGDRYDLMLEAIESERKSEEEYFLNLSSSKSYKERIAKGVLWYPVEITKKHYTIGEYVELELMPATPSASSGSNNFKVGASAIFFINKDERIELKGAISYANRRKVRIIISTDLILKEHILIGAKCGIELIYDDRPYRVMKDSIHKVKKSKESHITEIREAIRSKNISKNLNGDMVTLPVAMNLNDSQKKAISGANRVNRIAIIHGPPGTGKTTTLVGLIQHLVSYEEKILVTAPSNGAVDLLAKKLSEKGVKVLRLGNVTRIGDSIGHLCLDEQVRRHKDWQHIKQVKIEAEMARREASKYKRKFGVHERQNRGLMYKEARQLKNWAKELEGRLVDQVISNNQVLCTTLIGCAHPIVEHLKFETVVIDEASQALEPECWTAMLKAKRLIMAGDHKQLPPTVKSSGAIKLNFEETILDRLSGHINESFMLNIQYRMHPDILSFSNDTFYDGKLLTDESVLNRISSFSDEPLLFIDTSGCGFEEELNNESRSRSNKQEYLIIREHILTIYQQLKGLSIGIISPYKDQVKMIRQEIENDLKLRNLDIEINSIDGFQGQEKDIIYISLVRSNDVGEIGFLKDYRRLNVAMTRAKEKLIIIGDMATLGTDSVYLKMADHIEKKGRYQSAWEYMVY